MEILEKLVGLGEADDEHRRHALIDSPFNRLAKSHKLYLGKQPGDGSFNRNGYWHNTVTGELLFDYHIFFQNVSSLLCIVETHANKLGKDSYESIDEEAQELGHLTKCIGDISGCLQEVVNKYKEKKLDINGNTLGISNRRVYEDLLILSANVGLVGTALVMRAGAPRDEKIKHNLIAQAKGLMKFYSSIKAEYERVASQSPL